MKKNKQSISILLALFMLCGLISFNALAGTNPSANVQNGDIWRYGTTAGVYTVDDDFNTALWVGDVRLSQQVIADNGNGNFDVELKIQGGTGIKAVYEEAVVYLLDESGSVGSTQWGQMRTACIALLDSMRSDVNAYFGIVKFGSTATTSLNLTNNRTTVRNTLNSLSYGGGGTDLLSGLNRAEQVLNSYTGNGPKHIVLITDGYPSGGTEAQCIQRVGQLKTSGIYVYAAGFGAGVNLSFINQLASNSESSVYVSTAAQLTNLLSLPNTGYGAAIANNALRNVAVNMGADIDFVSIIANNGGGASVTAINGTLYWDPGSVDLTTARTLVYRIQMKSTALDQGFRPVSSSAVLRYEDNNGRSRTERFDIPRVQMVSSVTVIFRDWDGKVLDTQSVKKGTAAVAPANPKRFGYTFTGWDVPFNNITDPTTVTARYTINYYNVNFVDWDGVVLKTESVAFGSTATPPANPSRYGYTFTGWNPADFTITAEAELSVTAQYEINKYDVTFVTYDGTVIKTQIVEHGSGATPPDIPTRTGHAFTGWDVDFSNVISDMTVTALWAPYLELTAESGTVTLTASLREGADLSAKENAQVILAVYDANGRMLSVTFASVSFNDTLVIEKVSAALPEGAIAKGFLWNAESIPLIEAVVLL